MHSSALLGMVVWSCYNCPAFIRGLLENVGAEIDPIRLIRRIKNGLEIPGLKDALIKILHDFNLQISLLEGCQTILHSDCTDLARLLQRNQTSGFFGSGKDIRLLLMVYDDITLNYSGDTMPDLLVTSARLITVAYIVVSLSPRCTCQLRE